MLNLDPVIVNLATALGIGLLIGAERERRKKENDSHAPAGIRTYTLASLAGAVSMMVGGELMLAATLAGVVLLTAVAYWRLHNNDPGLTSEIALGLIVVLGGLAVKQPEIAAALGVTVAILLAARSAMHHFVSKVLTEDEVRDALIFAGATLVVLPLLPDRAMGPFDALNLHKTWVVVILVMGISAAGYIAVRALGSRYGLPITGLASGFISSSATIGAMGARFAKTPNVLKAAVAGAVLSTVATVLQMVAVLATTSMETLRAMAVPLTGAGIVAAAYGAAFTLQALKQQTADESKPGKAFSIKTALAFAGTLAVILIASAAMREGFGETGAIVAAALAGFVDTHSAAISIAALVASGKMTAAEAVLPILAGFTTNTISKMIFAQTTGGAAFSKRVIPGLILVALAAWAGFLLVPLTS